MMINQSQANNNNNKVNLAVEHGKYLIKLVLQPRVDASSHVLQKIRHSSDWIY